MKTIWRYKMKKYLLKIITIMIVLALPIAFLASCSTPTKQDYTQAYVSVKINPELELAVDEDGNVEEVYCVNEDAEVLLSQTTLVGMNIEEAIETIVDEATNAGYIDVEDTDNEVEIGVITEEGQSEDLGQKLHNRLKEKIHKYFDNNGIFGVVSEATLEQYAEQAAELGLSLGKTKMILRALELNPMLDINELKDAPMNELAKGIVNKVREGKVDATLREQFKEQRDSLIAQYPEIATLIQEIDVLTEQLVEFQGTEDEKLIIEAELASKEQELDAKRTALAEQIEEIRETYKQQSQELKAQHAEGMEQRKQQNQQKVQEHKKSVNKEKISAVQKWRENK